MRKNLKLRNEQIVVYRRMAVVGQVAAGDPLTEVEYLPFLSWRDVRVPGWASESDRFVVVNLVGDSLRDLGVYDGDYAVIHITQNIREGDLLAVMTPFGMMIKFVFVEDETMVRLEGASANFEPVRMEAASIEVQGRVVRTERDW